MKPNIHPKYEATTVTCSCGNVFETRSTKKNLRVDLCSNCHPFYTGEQRIVDTAGQVERFMRRLGAADQIRNRNEQQAEQRRTAEDNARQQAAQRPAPRPQRPARPVTTPEQS